MLKTLVDMDNKRLDEIKAREAKRNKINEGSTPGSKELEGVNSVQASESTKQSLLERELALKHQEEVDTETLGNKLAGKRQTAIVIETVDEDCMADDANGM